MFSLRYTGRKDWKGMFLYHKTQDVYEMVCYCHSLHDSASVKVIHLHLDSQSEMLYSSPKGITTPFLYLNSTRTQNSQNWAGISKPHCPTRRKRYCGGMISKVDTENILLSVLEGKKIVTVMSAEDWK